MSYSDYTKIIGFLLAGGLISFFLCGLIFSYSIAILIFRKNNSINSLKKNLHLIGILCIFPFLIALVAVFRWGAWPGGWVNLMIAGGSISFLFLLVRFLSACLGRRLGNNFYLAWFFLLLITNYSFFVIIFSVALIRLIFQVEVGFSWL